MSTIVTMELSDEMIEKIVLNEITEQLDMIDPESYLLEEDKQYYEDLIDALCIVHNYYALPCNWIEEDTSVHSETE